MILSAPAASARPDVISLDILLNDVDEGRVRIPKFQRPYVWTSQMMRELFESVISGYPIGSLLFWTPRELKIDTMKLMGPLPIPEPRPGLPISLVLDGHQRLATLYGVLRLPESFLQNENEATAEELGWFIGYDLRTQETRQMRRPGDFNSTTILPFRSVLKTTDFVRFARNIDSDQNLSEQEKSTYLDRADAIQRSIRDYRIALTSMRDGGVDDAVQIFSRINRSGRRMSVDQMAVALTYKEGFNLEDALDRILMRLSEFGFGDVSRTIILQTLLYGTGQNFTKPKFEELRSSKVQAKLQDSEEAIAAALANAGEFLNTSVGLKTGKLLPYALQLLCLAVFFQKLGMGAQSLASTTKAQLQRWFWATSFSGWFASANSSEMMRAADTMSAFASASSSVEGLAKFERFFLDRPLRPFPKTFDRRSARIRAMLLVQMMAKQPIDPTDNSLIDGSLIFADPNRADIPYVFPPDGSAQARSPANRILLDRVHGAYARTLIENHSNNFHAWDSHCINPDAISAALAKNIQAFVSLRETEIKAQEAIFLKQFSLEISESLTASVQEVDAEDS
jgi:Protein of unknown function DUF262